MSKPDKIVDSMLVLSYQSGNNKALALLVKRWHKKLCRQAHWYTKDMDVAKDLAQDSWQSIMKSMHKLKDSHQFGSWAMTIVTRKAIDHLNKKKKVVNNFEMESLSTIEDEHSMTEGVEDGLAKVKAGLARLTHEKRVVLTLFYIEEYSLKEMSEILDVSLGTVKTRLFRAREKLKTILKTSNYEK